MQTGRSYAARLLQAEAEVAIAEPASTISRVFDHVAGHDAEVRTVDGGAIATLFFGTCTMLRRPNGIVMKVEARDEGRLAYLKGFMASHLVEFVEGDRPRFTWTGDGAETRTFPNLHEMTVERIVDLTPHMRRVTLAGPGLDRYLAGGQHLKLFVPPAGVDKPEWPYPGKDGITIWPELEKRPTVRIYTVRNIDLAAGTCDVDFVLHGDFSVGSRWASHVRPGDIVGMRGPVGRPVPQADWYLLVGDETALPVIARTLESLPASAKGVALIEIADAGERQPISYRAGVELRWLHRDGAEPGTTTLLIEAVSAIAMPEPGIRIHAMAGVEYSTFKAIRSYWLDELKLSKKDTLAASYWRRGRYEGEVVQGQVD